MDVLELLKKIKNASKKCNSEEEAKKKKEKKVKKVKVKKEASLSKLAKKEPPIRWFTIDTGDEVYTYTITKKSAVENIEDVLIDLTTKVVTLEKILAPHKRKAAAEDLLNEKHDPDEIKTRIKEVIKETVGDGRLDPEQTEKLADEILKYFISIEPAEEFDWGDEEEEDNEDYYRDIEIEYEPTEWEGDIADFEENREEGTNERPIGASVKVAKKEKEEDQGIDLFDLGLDLGLEEEKGKEKKEPAEKEKEKPAEKEKEEPAEKGKKEEEIVPVEGTEKEEIEVAELPVDKIKEAIDKGEKTIKLVIKVGSVTKDITLSIDKYADGQYILKEAAESNPKKWVYDVARKIVYPMPTTEEPVIAREEEKHDTNKRVWGREEPAKGEKPKGEVVWARESEKTASIEKKAAIVNELVREMVLKEMLEPERAEIMKDIYLSKASEEELEAKLASIKNIDGSKAFVDEEGEIILLDNLI